MKKNIILLIIFIAFTGFICRDRIIKSNNENTMASSTNWSLTEGTTTPIEFIIEFSGSSTFTDLKPRRFLEK